MLAKRAVGQGAASKKYDVLTALGSMACAESNSVQRTILRFMTLITARYNWSGNELSMGRAEIARLWQVNERTVKRELAKLKDRGWLTVKRPAARGRVTVYGIDWDAVLISSRPFRENVGPDFVARLAQGEGPEPETTPSKVIAFPAAEPKGQGPWAQAAPVLHREDPAFYTNWCASLVAMDVENGVLELVAPSAFHAQYLQSHGLDRLYRSVFQVSSDISRIVISVDQG